MWSHHSGETAYSSAYEQNYCESVNVDVDVGVGVGVDVDVDVGVGIDVDADVGVSVGVDVLRRPLPEISLRYRHY